MRPIPTVILALMLCAGTQGASAQAPSDLVAGQVMKVDHSAGKITNKTWADQETRNGAGHDHGFQGPGPGDAQSR